MEIIQLAEQKKALAPVEIRYKNPEKEAMQLRKLWTHYKPLVKEDELREANNLVVEVQNIMEDEHVLEKLDEVYRLINKGLFYNPRLHKLHALKGNIHFIQGKWLKAIKSFEDAKLLAKFNTKGSIKESDSLYNEQITEVLIKRGEWYLQNDMLLEALGDYEEIYKIKIPKINVMEIQDTLLEILRKLKKYVTFEMYWHNFIVDVDPQRGSHLLAVHAEYKIFLKEMSGARSMLLKALSLNEDNGKALELLQVVYSTGQALCTHSILWCMYNCYDKALLIVEKALDCNPYSPGLALLKTIVLRLAQRYEEANSWLESVSENFYKLLEPTTGQETSLLGKFTIQETRNQLIKQWYLIRYDMALKCILNDQLNKAASIIYRSNLVKHCVEPYILLGDCFLKREEINMALKSYLKCREKMREMRLPVSRKKIDLVERIINILNDRAETALNKGDLKRVIAITSETLQILEEDHIPLHELRIQRGRALLYQARALFQKSRKNEKDEKINKKYCNITADSLRFTREVNEDLYRTFFDKANIEGVIDRFAPTRKLPRSLKILMQFS